VAETRGQTDAVGGSLPQSQAPLRVLVLSYETPSYPSGGGPSRQHALLEPLASRHRIRVLSTGGRPALGNPPAGVDIALIDPGPPLDPPDERWFQKNLRHYFVGEPWLYRLGLHHTRALDAALATEIGSFDPDLVVVEHEELIPLLSRLPAGMPSVLVFHNILLEVQWQNRRQRRVWDSIKALLELLVLARVERGALGRASRSIVVSVPNRRLTRMLRPSAAVAVIPNCLDVEYFHRRSERAPKPVIVMTASYHYPPNQVAARELVEEVFPAVRAEVPVAELRLVGQQMPRWLQTLAEATPGVKVVGEVDDVRPELERAWVAVATLKKGSGSPLKALEALAMGVPVVATRRVSTSLGLGLDDGLIIARRRGDIAREIVSLLNDDGHRARLAAAGERAVRARFDSRVVARALEREWLAATGARR
jgi:glycosyltransferase involved in cell wall biosynthesis